MGSFVTAEARAHARLAEGLPGFAAPAAARYAEATHDPLVIQRLRTLAERPLDGLWPAGGLAELTFALWYLVREGVDVRRHCPAQVQQLASLVAREGLPIFEGAPSVDCDASAVALYVAHMCGIKARFPTEWLERFWSSHYESYVAYDHKPTPNVSTEVHVLEAFMAAPDVTEARRREVWQRTIRMLDARPWNEKVHLSPFFVWEQVASMGYRHAHRFPADPTSVHEQALDQILAHQEPSGGFRSLYVDRENQEETGFALMALHAALEVMPPGERRDRAARAAQAGRAFLVRERALGAADHPELWTGKALTFLPHLLDAIVLAALARTPMASAALATPEVAVARAEVATRGSGIPERHPSIARMKEIPCSQNVPA